MDKIYLPNIKTNINNYIFKNPQKIIGNNIHNI